jgi:hypothetical protein
MTHFKRILFLVARPYLPNPTKVFRVFSSFILAYLKQEINPIVSSIKTVPPMFGMISNALLNVFQCPRFNYPLLFIKKKEKKKDLTILSFASKMSKGSETAD